MYVEDNKGEEAIIKVIIWHRLMSLFPSVSALLS